VSITEYPFDEKHLHETGFVFPEKIEKDNMVIYHSTSSVAEAKIEAQGLILGSPSHTVEEVDKVLAIFKGLWWKGSRDGGGGYPVLQHYSRNFDYNSDGSKKNFFHLQPGFCHAKKDFSGGETSRALRYCFKDLRDYEAHPEDRRSSNFRRWLDIHDQLVGIESLLPSHLLNLKEKEQEISVEHVMELIKILQKKLKTPKRWNKYKPSDSRLEVPDDAEWVKLGLEGTKSIEERCQVPLVDFRYGVIYAVKFDESELETLKNGEGGMGIYTSEAIDPKRIVAKIKIPAYFEEPTFSSIAHKKRQGRHLDKVTDPSGITMRLKSQPLK